MNKSLRVLAIALAVMFFLLLANVTAGYMLRSDALKSDLRNSRVRDEQFGSHRGDILAGNAPIAGNNYTGVRPFLNERTYANGELYAPVTGYFSYNYGAAGLESSHNDLLIGESDQQFVGRVIDTLSGRTQQGGNVVTTIDPAAQQAAWDALAGQEGAIVAMDYTTGEIKAMVSTPSYNPARLSSTDLDAAASAWDELNADPNQPMKNRASKEIYPPGSTFKLVVSAAALADGYTPDQMIDTPARLQLPQTNHELPNASNCGDGQQTLDFALSMSCNTSFANIGMALGEEKIAEQAKKFGFGTALGKDFESTPSVYPSGMSQASLAMSAIGQYDVRATPLQMTVVAGAIANDGKVMQPYLVAEERDSNQKLLSKTKPTEFGRAMSAENAKTLQRMMQHVVSNGLGKPAQMEGTVAGGKTGTAENEPGHLSSWYSGYMEQNHIAISVFVRNARGGESIPMAKQVLEAMR
ncbi:peptidoglycan D,D-transpeptidase FtsI family protein [Propionimicrobium lymphophilum]|uniref:peptidoglycan D,D-transpeptidase FtsI family protein n=1 Tax=Propionimicrobium lymphophilum TaxID=33012 RepID=UPI003EC5EDD0